MRKKVLWVDDEIEFLRSHAVFLETRGYAVTVASGGDEALRMIRAGGGEAAFDIVLLDKQMPIKSGGATLDEIKERYPNLPVVMITGYQHAADAAFKSRYDGYLTKPVDPNKLLNVCKQIIDARQHASRRISDKYLRAYTEHQARLSTVLTAADRLDIVASIAKWDIELGGVAGGEAIRQAHAGLKSDFGKAFCGFAIENYADWVRGGKDRPPMSVDIVEKIVVPELAKGRAVLMVMLNGMRLDQFLAIEPLLKKTFTADSALFMSALPTVSNIGTVPIASGLYPGEAAKLEPDVFDAADSAAGPDPTAMKRLMRAALKRAGAGNIKTFYTNADGAGAKKRIQTAVTAIQKAQTFGAVTFDIMNKFVNQSAVTSDAALREQISEWFTASPILAMMREACVGPCTVILTSAHGHTRRVRASEIYEVSKLSGRRCLFGNQASGDAREIFLLEDLAHFGLPQKLFGTKCMMARESYYFTIPGKNPKNTNYYQCGGISFEEMVMPLYILR